MADPHDTPPGELVWSDRGAPRSARFDDVYFAEDGLAESRTVFLQGCGLPDAWSGRRRFTVAELGFGTGLNVLALLELWRTARPQGAQLHVFSVEAYPITPAEADRALAAFPELAALAAPLLAGWPTIGRGFVRIDFPALGAALDLAIGEAAEALEEWSGAADAWFLDGFAPSKNPEMWRGEVLDLVRARSAPGARLATFTVAGAVRRGLAERGFVVSRAPGHGRKRERLEAHLPGPPASEEPPRHVAVVGAGVAGASLARAFSRLGAAVTLFDPEPGGGASGNPAALVSPRLDVSGGPAARLYAQASARAAAVYPTEAPDAVIARGAVRLGSGPKDPGRFAALADSPLFPRGSLRLLDSGEAAELLGEAVDGPALHLRDALTIAPEPLVRRWADPHARRARVAAVRRSPEGWELLAEDGEVLGTADIVCLAPGHRLPRLAPEIPLEPVRGQATWSSPLADPPLAASWGGYSAPTPDGGVIFGATHDRGSEDETAAPEDDERNLQALAARRPALAEAVRPGTLQGRASVRATTRDRAPLAGVLPSGAWVLGGLGGRGFTAAPLLAEHVAATALGAPSPLPRSLALLVDPARLPRSPSEA